MHDLAFVLAACQDLGERRRLAALYEHASSFYSTLEPLVRLKTELDSLPDTFTCQVGPVLEFARSGAVQEIVTFEAKMCCRSLLYQARAESIESDTFKAFISVRYRSLVIAICTLLPEDVCANAMRNAERPKSIQMSPVDGVHYFLEAGGATVRPYTCSSFDDHNTLTAESVCIAQPEFLARNGMDLVTHAGRGNFVIDTLKSSVCMLQAHSAKHDSASVCAEFSAEDGKLIGASAADDQSSRVQMVCSALRHLGRMDALEPFNALLEHKDHFVRWHVVQESMVLDKRTGLQMAAKLIDDRHPHVRNAAIRTLSAHKRLT